MAKVSDQNSLSLENYFSQGLSGITKQKATQSSDFSAFKLDTFLGNPNVERHANKSLESLLQHKVLDNYVLDNLQGLLVQDEGFSTAEYARLVHNLAQALKAEAKKYAADSREAKILLAASKLAQQLELGRMQYKEGRDALLPA